jgi:transposase
MPSIAEELGREGRVVSRAATLAKRRANAEAKAELPSREIRHAIPTENRGCPKCGRTDLKPLGDGKTTVLYEYIPPRFEKQVHVQETLVCKCGEGIVTAPGPARPIEKGHYGPGLMAHVVTAKCGDSMPLYRLAKGLRRAGVPINRTTLGDLFHASADAIAPLAERLLQLIAQSEVVLADETPMRVQAEGKTKKSFLWTFRTADTKPLIGFRYSPSRSGETPVKVLGETKGFLVADGYTGYNQTTVPERRTRVGCWAHVRRKFFDALSTAPEAQGALDFILALYRIEYEARDSSLLGSTEHLAMRQSKSAAVIEALRDWLAIEKPKHPPKTPIGEAIGYAMGQWKALIQFLQDARLPLDNNASERALRPAALGRKNYLFVGNDGAGENIAGLYSLVATCEENGINPETYLADVLIRVNTHPASRIDELLPHRWRPATDC